MVQSLSIIFFLGFLPFLSGFLKVPVFCVTLYNTDGFTIALFASEHEMYQLLHSFAFMPIVENNVLRIYNNY